jgi:hypothetical protein
LEISYERHNLTTREWPGGFPNYIIRIIYHSTHTRKPKILPYYCLVVLCAVKDLGARTCPNMHARTHSVACILLINDVMADRNRLTAGARKWAGAREPTERISWWWRADRDMFTLLIL